MRTTAIICTCVALSLACEERKSEETNAPAPSAAPAPPASASATPPMVTKVEIDLETLEVLARACRQTRGPCCQGNGYLTRGTSSILFIP